MKKRKVKIIIFSLLTVFVSGFFTLLLIGITLIPIVRKYTVTNNTKVVIFITPLIQFGVSGFSMDEEWNDSDKMKEYVRQVDNFSIISQYLSYRPPALPSFVSKDIKINPNSEVVFYIDYEEIKQEGGPQILLIKDNQNKYCYKDADFWESDIISEMDLLQAAPKTLIKSKDTNKGSFISWLIVICLLTLIILFPFLLIKNIILLKNERIRNLNL